uniref:Abnormal spindle microtubule assembly n=1 Tax=Fundulus heteroclitus TaxID=8078 RepID=A0A3Q2P7P5_FUNHE
MSFRTYTAKRKLNRLRRSACQLFTSEAVVKAIQRLELEVEARRLLVRKDRHLWKDIGERKKVLNWLLSYNPLWLRIGLETIFGELISLESNSDVLGLAMFVLQRLLWNPDIAAEFRHARVPHLYKDGHEEALSRFTLKKLLLLVCFLDKAKESRLIEHDPCLFCVDAEFKATKDLLLAFSRDFLSGEGILPRHLAHLGFPVSHVQTPLDEFNFAVKNLAVDLKCGIRLVRVMELLVQDWSLSAKLRLPAISRLQKVHNVDVALQVLRGKGIDLKDESGSIIDSRDIADGHREKTLSLLWKIIFAFQVILDEDQLREEVVFLKRALRTKRRMALVRADKGLQPSPTKTRAPYEHASPKIRLLMDWVCAVCDFYHLKVENFTVSFSDGRVLCFLLHHYHPGLLPAASIRHRTTQTVECSPRGRLELSSEQDSPSLVFKELLENEKNNFHLVNSAVAFLGGVPAMINPADMSNTIPNEKVVMSYLSFLCARLLDLRTETRAVRIIQAAWRKHKLKKDLKEYLERKAACVTLQAAFRGMSVRSGLRKKHEAATVIQSAVRMLACRKRYVLFQSAAIVLQSRYRAKVLGEEQRRRYRAEKSAAVVLQAAFRGLQARKEVSRWHQAAAVIQAQFRKHRERVKFQAMRLAAVIIQRRYRALILAHRVRTEMAKMHKAATVLQSHYRRRKQQEAFRRRRWAACVLQQRFRALKCGRLEAKRYQEIGRAALTLQAAYRGTKVLEAARAERRLRFTAAVFHHLSAIKIQRALRAQRALRSAKAQIHSVVTVQRWVRARLQRRQYLEDRRKVVTVQRAVRCWLARRHRAAAVIQQAVRRFLLLRRQDRVHRGIAKAQALWRGHRSRLLSDDPKLVALRHRVRKVSAEVREEDKLCNKTSSALQYLLQYKHFSYILEALKNLETATRLSPECCERLVESGATKVIFTLIRSCNRSGPCMEVIAFSVQILLNLSKYHMTIEAVYSVENSLETLLDLLQKYREKAGDKVAEKGGSIFTKACFLLALLLQDKRRAEVCKAIFLFYFITAFHCRSREMT